MVTRREIRPDDGTVCLPPDWLAAEAITAPEALAMMTTGSARALFREAEVGHLAAGMFADLIVVPENPLTIDPVRLPEIDVRLAMVGGEVGYSAPGPSPLGDAFRENLALGRPVTASASLADHPPGAAVDGDLDSYWGAGDFAPQWIEIDLGGAFTVDNIQLVTDQFPGGDTRHIVSGKGTEPGAEFVPLHEFGRYTRTGEILGCSPPTPWEGIRYVRIETVESPSWVAWRDVEVVRWTSPPLGVGDGGVAPAPPRGMALAQNAPNPFNPSTTIAFEIPGAGRAGDGGRVVGAVDWQRARIVVHDLRGRRVRTLFDEERPAGAGRVTWDGRDDRGRRMSSGVYLYSLRVAGRTLTRKMTLLE